MALFFSRPPSRGKEPGSWLARATSGARPSTSRCGHCIARAGRGTGSAFALASAGALSLGICAAKPFPSAGRVVTQASLIDPWQSVVIEHWNEGRRNGCTLLRDLQRLGYRGSYATLMYYLRRLKALQEGAAPDSASAKPRPVLTAVAPRRELTPRIAAW